MNARTLLVVGLGLLLLGLLLVLGIDDPATTSQQAVLVQGYLSNVCALLGSGLVIAAGLVSALRKPQPQPQPVDHYS